MVVVHVTKRRKMFLPLALLLLVAIATATSPPFQKAGRSSIHVQNINVTAPWLSVVNTRGMGYYYSSFYQGTSCAGTPTYQEGYVTGKCLQLGSPAGISSPHGTSIRMDCSATCKLQNILPHLLAACCVLTFHFPSSIFL